MATLSEKTDPRPPPRGTHTKFGEVRQCGFPGMRADRPTHYHGTWHSCRQRSNQMVCNGGQFPAVPWRLSERLQFAVHGAGDDRARRVPVVHRSTSASRLPGDGRQRGTRAAAESRHLLLRHRKHRHRRQVVVQLKCRATLTRNLVAGLTRTKLHAALYSG